MNRYLKFLLVALITVALIGGCVSTWRSAKTSPETPSSPESPVRPPAEDEETEGLPAPPTEGYVPPPPPDQATVQRGAVDLRMKDEIEAAALKFADNFKGIMHVKTCYSKLYGGWYLFLYSKKGKDIRIQQFSWDDKSDEWEVVYRDRVIPEDKLEVDLKSEVDDETCFILR